MELLAIAVYSFGMLGKGFDEVMPHNDNEFLVKTIENVEEKLHFLSFFGENEFFPKFDDTEWFVENLWRHLR
jgi:hypothetical protein